MKTFLPGICAYFFVFALISGLSSCNGNDEEVPPPENIYKATYQFIPLSPVAIVDCNIPGTNCSNPWPHPGLPGLRTDQISILNTFYRMSENDSASYFFDHYDWQSMFPELDTRQEIVSKVITGDYKVKLMGDSSVVIVSNEAIHSNNIIFAFNRNCENSAD